MSDRAWEAAMDRFTNEENVERYRRLANEAISDTERLQVLKLLAVEVAKFKLELKAASQKNPTIAN